jgi:hypothetical protein
MEFIEELAKLKDKIKYSVDRLIESGDEISKEVISAIDDLGSFVRKVADTLAEENKESFEQKTIRNMKFDRTTDFEPKIHTHYDRLRYDFADQHEVGQLLIDKINTCMKAGKCTEMQAQVIFNLFKKRQEATEDDRKVMENEIMSLLRFVDLAAKNPEVAKKNENIQ